jgi:glycosyltransferase involved in cell wall biosynthesis
MTTVSALITAYRRRKYLRQAVQSVLDQSDRPDEITVSKDFEEPELDRFVSENGVTSVLIDECSVGHQLADGIRRCHSDVISFLDDDDLFAYEKVRRVRAEFDRDPNLILLRNGFVPLDEEHRLANPDRTFPQTRHRYHLISPDPKPRDLRFIVRHRAYGNQSTISIRRLAILSRLDELEKTEAGTDGATATLMLDAGGGHLFIPERMTVRRIGSSVRTQGTGVEAERAVRTYQRLLDFVQEPLARDYASYCLSWAKVDRFLRQPGSRLTFEEWSRYVRSHLSSTTPHTWVTGARSLWKMVRA